MFVPYQTAVGERRTLYWSLYRVQVLARMVGTTTTTATRQSFQHLASRRQ